MGKRILIVDDSASIRQVVGMALRGAGYEVEEAADGREALERLEAAPFHLVVSDLNMPRLDGLGLVRAARADTRFRFMPFILLTTVSGEDRKAEGKAAGVRAWVVKPFLPPQLLDAVAKLALP